MARYPRIELIASIFMFLGACFLFMFSYYIGFSLSLLVFIVVATITIFILTVLHKTKNVKLQIDIVRRAYQSSDLKPTIGGEKWLSGIGYTGRLKHRQTVLYTNEGIYVHYGAQVRKGSVFMPWENINGGYDIATLSEGSLCLAFILKGIPFLIAVPYEPEYYVYIPNSLKQND